MIPSYVSQNPVRKNSVKAKYWVLLNDYSETRYFETIEEALACVIENNGVLGLCGSGKCLAYRYEGKTRLGFGANDLTRKELLNVWWANWDTSPLAN